MIQILSMMTMLTRGGGDSSGTTSTYNGFRLRGNIDLAIEKSRKTICLILANLEAAICDRFETNCRKANLQSNGDIFG